MFEANFQIVSSKELFFVASEVFRMASLLFYRKIKIFAHELSSLWKMMAWEKVVENFRSLFLSDFELKVCHHDADSTEMDRKLTNVTKESAAVRDSHQHLRNCKYKELKIFLRPII